MYKIVRSMVAVSVAVLSCGSVMAEGVISLNFMRDSSEAFAGGQAIGPLATDSAHWNSVAAASGSFNNLKDDEGNATAADVVWQSKNLWSSSEVYTNDQQKLSRGYLDDGTIGDGMGISITVTDIPYAKYRVYGLLGSDLSNGGASYITRDFLLNGSVWVFGGVTPSEIAAYGNATVNYANKGSYWTEAGGGIIGNYWTQVASGPTLTVRGQISAAPKRGSLTGVIIEEITVPHTISINLAQNSNQDFADGSGIGPLSTDSATWNSTINSDSGDLVSGTKTNLIDVFGNKTGVDFSWRCKNTYWNGVDGITTDNRKLAVGYLDDGNGGNSVTFSNIPFASYRVYGLLSSDTVNYRAQDFNLNGGIWTRGGYTPVAAPAYRNITMNNASNGTWWTEITGTVTGNYWTAVNMGSTLTIHGQDLSGVARGALAGVILEEVPLTVSTNRMVGFNFRGNLTSGSMDAKAIAGAPTFEQRYWANLNSDWFNNAGAIPPRFVDSFGQLVGNGNITNNGIRLEFDGIGLFNNGIDDTVSPDYVLMQGYMDSNNTANQPYIQIWNIPYEKFDIVVYVDGDGDVGAKCGAYWIEEATAALEGDGGDLTSSIYTAQIGNPDFDGTYTRVPLSSVSAATASPGNYIVFAGLTHSDVTLRGQQNGTRAPINAFQVVDRTPPPGPLYPVGTILLLL